MYLKYAELLSLLLIVTFQYKKTKDKIILWILGYVSFLVSCIAIFRVFFPEVPLFSPTLEYTVLLIVVGIPFLIVFAFIFYEVEKRRSRKLEEDKKDAASIFKLSRDNIIFWTIIVLVNLIAFLLDKNQ